MTARVSLVIVSHSPGIARGTVDMVRQMVGDEIAVVGVGGRPDGSLGTDCPMIRAAIESVYSEAGVAILVDLGGAETNSEMAIEQLPPAWADRVTICDAAIVEGAIMAATEAAAGADLDAVRQAAEEY